MRRTETEELEVILVVAGWANGNVGEYRTPNQALPCIKKVTEDNPRSDMILFPGGFINRNGDKYGEISDVLDAVNGYLGMVMTGFDRTSKDLPGSYACLVLNEGRGRVFSQAALTHDDVLDEIAARDDRMFIYKNFTVGVACCGELFHSGLRDIAFSHTPDFLFDCVHTGQYFRHRPMWKQLDANSRIGSFYTYHVQSFFNLHLKTLAGTRPKESRVYDDLNLGTLRFRIDTSQSYKFMHC